MRVLGKVAVGVALVAVVPVIFIAAAAGSLDARGATTAAGVCASDTKGGSPLAAAPSDRATEDAQAFLRPCQAGELEAMVLSNPRIGLRPEARGDVVAGLIDPRVLQVLLFLAERHDLNFTRDHGDHIHMGWDG